jgi:NADH-quinone oxidoreductase subunit N
LFGLSLLYLNTGSFSIQVMQGILNLMNYNPTLIFIGFIFCIIGLSFKLGVAPFHFWISDIYEGSPTPATMFFSLVPKTAIFLTLIKILLFSNNTPNQLFLLNLIHFFGICSIIFGSLGAVFQRKMKRLLAFSTVTHTGFILFALSNLDAEGLKAMWFYFFFYLLTNFGLFLYILSTTTKKSIFKYLINWSSFSKHNKVLILTFSLILLSSSGIPPLFGFFSKMLVFICLLQNQKILISLVLITFSTISCFYYIRLIKIFYFSQGGVLLSKLNNKINLNPNEIFISILFIITISILFFLNNPFWLSGLLGILLT